MANVLGEGLDIWMITFDLTVIVLLTIHCFDFRYTFHLSVQFFTFSSYFYGFSILKMENFFVISHLKKGGVMRRPRL